jgi:NAD(P)-dependent dehydrogenase (short-subunit alcohol dehydrogenase family)
VTPARRPGSGVALISGAGSGIGRAVALELARRGQRLALIGRTGSKLEQTLEGSGAADAGLVFELDVRDAGAVTAAVARVERELGPVEVVVPAAGEAVVAPFDRLPAAEFDRIVAVNLLGAANLFRACLPAMLERRRGTLVAILSVASRQAFPGWSAYAASKWGLLGLVESLRADLAEAGLRVLALTPGATDSPLWDGLPGDWDRTKMIPAREVARLLGCALDAGGAAAVEEIRMRPPGGDL